MVVECVQADGAVLLLKFVCYSVRALQISNLPMVNLKKTVSQRRND